MKKLLFLFIPLLFISCSGDDDDNTVENQTFLERFDGVMFQSDYCAYRPLCYPSAARDPLGFQYHYISFHNENMFIKEVYEFCGEYDNLSCNNSRLDCTQTLNGISYLNHDGIIYEIKNEILVNSYDELKIKTTINNSTSDNNVSTYERYLVKEDSLSIETQSSSGQSIHENRPFGKKHYKSLTTYKDLCE